MTSAGSGIVHEVVERLGSSGWFGGSDGFEVILIEVLNEENLAITTQEPLIFLEREHHDARYAVPLDTDRVKHCLIGIISKFARDLLGRDRQQRFSHTTLLDPRAAGSGSLPWKQRPYLLDSMDKPNNQD
jgi:hypothetical protein